MRTLEGSRPAATQNAPTPGNLTEGDPSPRRFDNGASSDQKDGAIGTAFIRWTRSALEAFPSRPWRFASLPFPPIKSINRFHAQGIFNFGETGLGAQAKITVSVVSHGQMDLVGPLLDDLDALCKESIAELILTINIPEPRGLEELNVGFPVRRIVNRMPMGFGANHNQAFGHSQSEWFLALNPDVRLADNVLEPLLALAKADTGIMAPRILEPGKLEPEAHRAMLTPWEFLMRRSAHYASPEAPAWIPGIFMLFRAAAFAEVAGFDPRFYMYCEDCDICARVRLAGWKIAIAPDLRAFHDARRAAHWDAAHLRWFIASLARMWLSSAFWRYRKLLRVSQK
jgi:N-acetylglucosaminyl-diphospho-decaprenol L-rhamnosyltransferase